VVEVVCEARYCLIARYYPGASAAASLAHRLGHCGRHGTADNVPVPDIRLAMAPAAMASWDRISSSVRVRPGARRADVSV
jgi:hypothetical protein